MSRRICAAVVFIFLAALSQDVLAQRGPDVIVGDLPSVQFWGSVGGIHAYSVGTTSCNVGDMDLDWISSTPSHPVIGQNMFRLKDGRIEQIGQSWLKHAFAAVNNGICGSCNGHLGSRLGVGCSDPYSAGLNGGQSRLGPRSEVNATTGVFPYPYHIGWQQTGNAIYKRLQVRNEDIQPSMNPGAIYFVEGHYVTLDDATWENQNNNVSYRRIVVNSPSNISPAGVTERTIPAIIAWADHGLGVNQPDPDVQIRKINVPNDGLFWLATKATDNGDGTWHYEYAIQNISSDRSGGSFSIPLMPGVSVTNTGFHDVDYHSGEPLDNTDWNVAVSASEIAWSSPQTFAQNPNSNALRWSTLYNFWFDADVAPAADDGTVTLGLFKPPSAGDPTEATTPMQVPGGSGGPCFGDLNGDRTIDLADLALSLASFGRDAGGDLTGDGDTDLEDLALLLSVFGTNCP